MLGVRSRAAPFYSPPPRPRRRPAPPPRVSPGDQPTSSETTSGRPVAPWSLTFDLRERETLWTEENQARLVRMVASNELALELGEVEERLRELGALLPALAARHAHVRPATLAALLRDPGALVPRLITCKQLLPGADIGALAAAEPELLLLAPLEELRGNVERLAQLLGPQADLDRFLDVQPRALDSELVSEVLEELRRLMPSRDPAQLLLGDPSWLLRVERGRRRLGDDPDT